MKFFLLIFIALLLFVTVGMLVVFYYVRKGIRYFRRMSTGDMDEEEFRRMADKHYHEKNDGSEAFDDDYFKGKGWQRNTARKQNRSQHSSAARTMRTADGVTIVDRRTSDEANKKIFKREEGEYVDFKESDN